MVNDYRCVGSLAEWLRQTSADFPELTIDDLIAKAVRAPESELKVSAPYFHAWTSGPENSLYMADLRQYRPPDAGTSSSVAGNGRIRTQRATHPVSFRPSRTTTAPPFGTGPHEGRDRCRTTW